jgi:uncharacterized metal-binding protein YceD (DUF177 family)
MTPPPPHIEPEFHRPFALDRLGVTHVTETVTATADERAALAVRLGIPALRSLACAWRLQRGPAGRIAAEGRLTARLVRVCVITLDEFTTDLNESFRVAFVPAGQETDDGDPEADDEIPYESSALDLGEAACEQLALALDPYPHRPGATLPDIGDAAGELSPFAALARRLRES